MNDIEKLESLKEEYELIDMRIQVCIAQRDAMDRLTLENIDKEGAEAQWECQRAAKMAYTLQKTKMKLDEQRYKKLLEICEFMHGKEEKKGLDKFVSDAKQQFSFIGSKVFKRKLSIGTIERHLSQAENAISKGGNIDFKNLTFAKIRKYMKFNRMFATESYKEYKRIYKQSYAKMIMEGFKEKYGREVSGPEEIATAMEELGPELDSKFTAELAKEVETKRAEKAAAQPLKSPVINAKPMKKEDLSTEQQQKFEEIHAKRALEFANRPRLESAEDKQIRIQGEISRIKSEINDIYENAVSPFGFTEEETQKLDAKRSEAALLQGQLDDMAAEEKRMFEENRKAKIEADKAARAERIDAINKKNAVDEAKRVLSHLKTSTGYYNVANLSDEEVLDTYKQIVESPSMAARLSEARLEAKAAKQTANIQPGLSINVEEKGQEPESTPVFMAEPTSESVLNDNLVTPESVFGTSVELEPTPASMLEPVPEFMNYEEMVREPEPTPVPIISESEELRNGLDNETVEVIAANLTPDMYEHYRSVMNSFEPGSEEYQNASAIVDTYDKQTAIDTLHHGNSR